MIINVGMSTW